MPVQIQFRRGTASEWTSANPTLSAGEVGFETDTNKFKLGTGSTAWTSLSYISPITASSADTLTNKTLTSPVIASVVNNTLTSTTGDMIYASAANTPARLGIGSSAQILTVSGGIPAWSTPAASGGMTLINTGGTTLSGTSNTISSIPSTYKHLLVVIDGAYASGGSGSSYTLRMNADTGSNYAWGRVTSFNAGTPASDFAVGTSIALGFRYGSSAAFDSANFTNIWIYNYTNAAPIGMRGQTKGTDGTPNFTPFFNDVDGVYKATAAISSVTLTTDNALTGGKIYVYGVS